MPPTVQHSIAEELRKRIHALEEDDQVALQQLHILEERKREINKTRERIKCSIHTFEKMLHEEEQR